MIVNQLSYSLGAEVVGLDVSKDLSEEDVAFIRSAWLEHTVLVFRGMDISLEEHLAFSRRFGELESHPVTHQALTGFPQILVVANNAAHAAQLHQGGEKMKGKPSGRLWHSDGAFTLRPPTASLLHCRVIPELGGDTLFTNMYHAYEALSGTMREVIDNLHVVNDLAASGTLKARDAAMVGLDLARLPPVVQPIVRIHPETGRKALYLNENVTIGIHGMTKKESRPLLDFLFAHSVRPEFTYRHRWRVSDLVMWDNRCTMHLAIADYDVSQNRELYRTTLCGSPLGRLYEETV